MKCDDTSRVHRNGTSCHEKSEKTARLRAVSSRLSVVVRLFQPGNRNMICRCGHTVGNYIRAYKEKGLPGLDRVKPSGKKSNLTDAQRQILKETVAYKRPDEVGFPARANWTLALGAQFIEREFGVPYTQKGVSKLFHALGLSYTRPTYTLKKADPERQRQFKEETFPALNKS